MKDSTDLIVACTALVSAFIGPAIAVIIIKIQNKNLKQVAFFNNIGQMRQEWINKLREKIAEVLSFVHQAHVGGIESLYAVDGEDLFYKRLLFLHREIQLMLNPLERKHIELEKKIRAMCYGFNEFNNTSNEMSELINSTTILAQSIFKEEWVRIKNGG